MDGLTTSVLAAAVYDLLKKGKNLIASNLKEQLIDWVLDDKTIIEISDKIQALAPNDEWSEIKLERAFEQNKELIKLLGSVQPVSKEANVNQVHFGIGDNNADITL